METRKKYKIALSEKYVRKSENGKEWFQFPLNISGQLVAIQTIIPLDPYTEPDMEQVRKEAYKEGREAGIKDGMCEAWEAARKIAKLNTDEQKRLFGCFGIYFVAHEYSAFECIEKIRQYEQEKEEQIQVGDEIETPSGLKGYVVNFTDDELVHYVSSEGRFGTMGTSAVSKTGRHFPEIAEVLQKMMES